MRCVASGLGLASAITVDSCTPSHWTSIFDQVVTQWKSLVSLTWGRARKSFQESLTGSSTAPSTISSHLEILTSGWRPRSSTGQPLVTVWPSGSFGIPWRFGGPRPSGRASAAAGVSFILPWKRSRSFMRASTIRLSFSSMERLYARTAGRVAASPECTVIPRCSVRVAPARLSLYPPAPPMRLPILNGEDKFHDECGVFGVFGHAEASNLAYLGIHALQHRGQESAGIVSSDGKELYVHRAMGEVEEIFQPSVLAQLPGSLAIGHTRYSTAGDKALLNAQPIMIDCNKGKIALGHNGNLTNAAEWRRKLEHRGSIFQTNSDTEVIVHLIARSQARNLSGAIGDALNQVEGAYSFLVLTQDELYAVRDPRGFRPLVLGKLTTPGGFVSWLVASETCAFDLLNAQYIREIEPGEMVRISKSGIESIHFAPEKPLQQCIFEHVYFSRPDSIIFGRSVNESREMLGRLLAREHPVDADIVVPVPDSGVPAAVGYALESKIPFRMGLIRNHYIGRTFIEPSQAIRNFGVKLKLNPIRGLIEGQRVILVDDSIVRGTTS